MDKQNENPAPTKSLEEQEKAYFEGLLNRMVTRLTKTIDERLAIQEDFNKTILDKVDKFDLHIPGSTLRVNPRARDEGKSNTKPPVDTSSPTSQETTRTQQAPIQAVNFNEFQGKAYSYELVVYINKCKNIFKLSNWTDDYKKALLATKLPHFMQNCIQAQVSDVAVTVEQVLESILQRFGPNKEKIKSQVLNMQINPEEEYVEFVNRVQELAPLAGMNDAQLILILNMKLPQHLTGSIRDCENLQDYIQQVESIKSQGWFFIPEDMFRQSLKSTTSTASPEGEKKTDGRYQQQYRQKQQFGGRFQNNRYNNNNNNRYQNNNQQQQRQYNQNNQQQNTQQQNPQNAVNTSSDQTNTNLAQVANNSTTQSPQSGSTQNSNPVPVQHFQTSSSSSPTSQNHFQPYNIHTNVASFYYQNDVQGFANKRKSDTGEATQAGDQTGHDHNTRFQKRQGVQWADQNQGTSQQNQQTQQQQQQSPQQSSQSTGQTAQSTQQPSNQQPSRTPEVDESIQRLLKKAAEQAQNQQNDQQQQSYTQGQRPPENTQNQEVGGQRGRRGFRKNQQQQNQNLQQSTNNIQQQLQQQRFTVLEANQYLNEHQQINLSRALKNVCIPVPILQILNMQNLEILQKQNQVPVQNQVFYQTTTQPVEQIVQPPAITYTQQETNNDLDDQSEELNDETYQALVNTLSNKLVLYNKQQNSVQNRNFSSFIDNQKESQLCIKIGINTQEVYGVLDPGADFTILSLRTAKRCGLENIIIKQDMQNQIGDGLYVRGCTGSERMYGVIEVLQANIQGHVLNIPRVFIQENASFEMIIGLETLKLFKIQMDMGERVATFQPYVNFQREKLILCDEAVPRNRQLSARVEYRKEDSGKVDVVQHVNKILTLYPNFPLYKTYQLILIDPPWRFKQSAMFNGRQPPYPCLTEQQLRNLPIDVISDPKGCIALMWSTATHLDQALRLYQHWGFTYLTVFLVWKKQTKKGNKKLGLGWYSRGVFEFLLLGKKGATAHLRRKIDKNSTVSQDLEATPESIDLEKPVTIHSQKPDIVYEKIEQVFRIQQLRCIEVFARDCDYTNRTYDLYGNTFENFFKPGSAYEEIKTYGFPMQTKFPAQIKTINNFFQDKPIYQQIPKLELNTLNESFHKQLIVRNTDVTQGDVDIKINQYCEGLKLQTGIDVKYSDGLKNLIKKYSTVFKFDNKLTLTNLGTAPIKLKPNSRPVQMKPYKIMGAAYDFMKNKFDQMEKDGLVSKGESDWATAVMTVPKESVEEPFRCVQNFKRVNRLTVKYKYPLRLIDHIYVRVKGKRWYCVLDMRGGFNQIGRDDASRQVMAMITPFGLYLPNVMFFGETNAPSIFQSLVDKAIGDLYGHGVECYIDDIVVYADTLEQLLSILEQLFIRLQKSNFKLHPGKCEFMTSSVTLLGNKIDGTTLTPKQKKINKILSLPEPKDKKGLQQFIGCINYYRKFIPDLATMFIPLQASANVNSKFIWGEQQKLSFDLIKEFISRQMTLYIPDLTLPYKVLLSISKFSYTACLLQGQGELEVPVQFHSQLLNNHRSNLPQYLKEVDCLCWALQEWRHYLQPVSFTVETDLNAIRFLMEMKSPSLQVLQYQIILQDYDFEVEKVGKNRLKGLLMYTALQEGERDVFHKNLRKLQDINPQSLIVPGQFRSEPKSPQDFDYTLQFDGACQTVKSVKAIGKIGASAYVIIDQKGVIINQGAKMCEGFQTNNVAEYQAVVMGLQKLISLKLNYKRVLIQGDSQLVIKQLKYEYMCNSEILGEYCQKARLLLRKFPKSDLQHIDRKHNWKCDKLAKDRILQEVRQKSLQQMGSQLTSTLVPRNAYNSLYNYFVQLDNVIDEICCKVCKNTEPEESMILCDGCNDGYHADCIGLDDVPDSDWYCKACYEFIEYKLDDHQYVDPVQDFDLIDYLKGTLDVSILDTPSYVRVFQRSKLYFLQNSKLYKFSTSGCAREIPTVAERPILVEQIHQLLNHLGIVKITDLICQFFYWPKMRKFIQDILSQCMLCRAHNPQYLRMPGAYPLDKIYKPMQALHLDCIKLPATKKNEWRDVQTHVVVAICGMTKWVEARPMRSANSKETSDFLFDDIICRYGTPLIVRTDNGSEFKRHFSDLCNQLNIVHIHSTPYYPQSNGQVERMNRTIKSGLVKLTQSLANFSTYDWVDLLPQVLMGIRFTVARPTSFSPYQLMFGDDPLIPGYQGHSANTTLSFPDDLQQEKFLLDKIKHKKFITKAAQINLNEMKEEIKETIQMREKMSPSQLEYGNLVFLRRDRAVFPMTKTQGPFVFIGYGDPDRTTALVIDPKSARIDKVSVTNINPLKIY